jgi:SAM-dependent methyltransferase
MIDVVPFDARRFKSAASHYLTGRPAYPARLIETVSKLCGLTPRSRVIDLGCGPGQLALAFAPFAQSVLAIDPEPEMLALCRAQVAEAGHVHIEVQQASSIDLNQRFGRFDLVVIGRAFHWMDRTATLQVLDTMIEPGGAVVLFGDRHPKLPENDWIDTFDEIVEQYASTDAGRAIRKSPNWVTHEAVLLASSFRQLERYSVIDTYHLPVDRIIDRALSRSSTTTARLGGQAEEMVAELRRRFSAEDHSDGVAEIVEATALIARRPPQAG